jgi:hypothetical protein
MTLDIILNMSSTRIKTFAFGLTVLARIPHHEYRILITCRLVWPIFRNMLHHEGKIVPRSLLNFKFGRRVGYPMDRKLRIGPSIPRCRLHRKQYVLLRDGAKFAGPMTAAALCLR